MRRFPQICVLMLACVYMFHIVQVKQDESANVSADVSKSATLQSSDNSTVDNFDPIRWEKLVQKYSQFPCGEKLTTKCVTAPVLELLGFPDKISRQAHLKEISNIALRERDSRLARDVLKLWPSEDSLRKKIESLTETHQRNSLWVTFPLTVRISLLALAAEEDKAAAQMLSARLESSLSKDKKEYIDFVEIGRLEEAAESARQAHKKKRRKEKLGIDKSHMHCLEHDPFTEWNARLLDAYLERGDFDGVNTILRYLRDYAIDPYFNTIGGCGQTAALQTYRLKILELMRFYSAHADVVRERETFSALKESYLTGFARIRRTYEMKEMETLAVMARKRGYTQEAEDISAFVEARATPTYRGSGEIWDPLPVMYALTGQVDKAFARIENEPYFTEKLPLKDLLSIEASWKAEYRKPEEVRLATYVRIAGHAADVGDKAISLEALRRARVIVDSYAVAPPGTYDYEMDNYIKMGNILLDIGEAEKSLDVVNRLLMRFDELRGRKYRGSNSWRGFYGDIALLLARHKDIMFVQAWADRLPVYFHGGDYSRIGEMLIKNERWKELDFYMPEMARVMSTDEGVTYNWDGFMSALIQAGEFDRYLTFFDRVDKGTQATHDRHGTTKQWPRKNPRGIHAEDTRAHIEMIGHLFSENLSGTPVPEHILKKLWGRFIKSCRLTDYFLTRDPENIRLNKSAEEEMAACHLAIIRGYGGFQREKKLKRVHAN